MQKWASHETWLARLLFSELPKYFEENYFLPPWRQHDVVYAMSILEERGDLLVGEAGYASADATGEAVLYEHIDESRHLGFGFIGLDVVFR